MTKLALSPLWLHCLDRNYASSYLWLTLNPILLGILELPMKVRQDLSNPNTLKISWIKTIPKSIENQAVIKGSEAVVLVNSIKVKHARSQIFNVLIYELRQGWKRVAHKQLLSQLGSGFRLILNLEIYQELSRFQYSKGLLGKWNLMIRYWTLNVFVT